MIGAAATLGAEAAVRAYALALLQSDIALSGLVQGIFDGEPLRATAPFVTIGDAEGSDWGTKDRVGREIRLSILLNGVGDSLNGAAAARIESQLNLLRGMADGWDIVSARIVRVRFAHSKNGGWRQSWVVRCRCLAAV